MMSNIFNIFSIDWWMDESNNALQMTDSVLFLRQSLQCWIMNAVCTMLLLKKIGIRILRLLKHCTENIVISELTIPIVKG